jgi:hypothetical protein
MSIIVRYVAAPGTIPSAHLRSSFCSLGTVVTDMTERKDELHRERDQPKPLAHVMPSKGVHAPTTVVYGSINRL